MIFATGSRERGAKLAVAKRAAKRSDSTDDPEHEQSKTGVNVGNLKSETGEDASADNVGNHNPAGREKADGSSRGAQIRAVWVGGSVHVGVDDGICARDWLIA